MMKRLDLTGQRFGKLTVVRFVGMGNDRGKRYLCKCDCGNEAIVSSGSLRCGDRKDCGCSKKEKSAEALLGSVFGKLTVIGVSHKNRRSYLLCKCECGKQKEVDANNLKAGRSKSCGCGERKQRYENLVGQVFGSWTVIKYSHKTEKYGHIHFLCRCKCGTLRAVASSRLKNGTSKSCGCAFFPVTKGRHAEKVSRSDEEMEDLNEKKKAHKREVYKRYRLANLEKCRRRNALYMKNKIKTPEYKEKKYASDLRYRKNNKKKLKEYFKTYALINHDKVLQWGKTSCKKSIENLNPGYIIKLIKKGSGLTSLEIKNYPELIETKKLIIKTKRLCKTLNN